jgi:hypothetical protein
MQQVDGLPWLACPWSPSSWYSKTSPSSAHSSFESIAEKMTTTHNKHTCIQGSHSIMQHTTQHWVSEANKFRYLNPQYSLQENIIQIEANQFLFATKPYSQTNKLQASTCIKIRHPAHIQATNNILEPTKLELGQKSKWVNYQEFPIYTNTR